MSGMTTTDRALEVVLRQFGQELKLAADDPALTPEEPLVSGRLGFSSFSFVRAVIAIEDEVEVELADEVFDTVHRCGTIGDVIGVVARALGGGER
ncbi:acyl carrier protein [Actinocorallia sp. B10E7]|uniref:acyl carrier protein n=1 Tax=Actinocorallia sp. B10E7 TaxID=3153558 RepID=UPI00325D179D